MRILILLCLMPLSACVWGSGPAAFSACAGSGQGEIDVNQIAFCAGLEDKVRVESFAAGDDGSFTYGAQTNTVMTENEDGTAERLRREWLAEALKAHAMCEAGYVVDTRRLVQQTTGPLAAGGDIVYAGRCL